MEMEKKKKRVEIEKDMCFLLNRMWMANLNRRKMILCFTLRNHLYSLCSNSEQFLASFCFGFREPR